MGGVQSLRFGVEQQTVLFEPELSYARGCYKLINALPGLVSRIGSCHLEGAERDENKPAVETWVKSCVVLCTALFIALRAHQGGNTSVLVSIPSPSFSTPGDLMESQLPLQRVQSPAPGSVMLGRKSRLILATSPFQMRRLSKGIHVQHEARNECRLRTC